MENKRRHIILINKSFQFRLIIKFIIVNIIILILFSIFLYLFLNSEVESNLQSAHVTYKNIKDMLFPIILTLSILNIIISSILISIFVLYASHKVAGPLYRFNEALKSILNRNLHPVTSIREGDQLFECSTNLKLVSHVFSDDISDIKKHVHGLKALIKKNVNSDDLLKKIEELENITNQYKI
ncbi:MAG: hypothetical protein JW864_15520 [Spirochaetes bacterium]|nr:hypothetical protein [Spirochaetota bacterium]